MSLFEKMLKATAVEAKHYPPGTLGRHAVWEIALFDYVELRGREVWARDDSIAGTGDRRSFDQAPSDSPFTLRGVLADDVTEEQFWAEVSDAYSK